MRSSANLSTYSDMPSFLSQSAICCMAVTPSGPDRVFHHGNREFTPISLRYHAWHLNMRANARRGAPLSARGLNGEYAPALDAPPWNASSRSKNIENRARSREHQ